MQLTPSVAVLDITRKNVRQRRLRVVFGPLQEHQTRHGVNAMKVWFRRHFTLFRKLSRSLFLFRQLRRNLFQLATQRVVLLLRAAHSMFGSCMVTARAIGSEVQPVVVGKALHRLRTLRFTTSDMAAVGLTL